MTDRRLIVFRSRLRAGVEDEYGARAERIFELAQRMPGYVSIKDFTADDGERCAIAEWEGGDALAAWRDEPEHHDAQRDGRARYYASYDVRVCSELRGAAFDATTGAVARFDRDPGAVRAIAERWFARFAQRDLDGLLALYTDDATHCSPKIRVLHPDTGGVIRGKPALRAWWQGAFDRLPSLRYERATITADARRAWLEYVRIVDGEPELPVAELFEIAGGKIAASRVFHG